tara:strand:- start:1268 stop:1585 length:318 start_codon:yes stop_codon:yes gene_type:complete
MSWKDEIKKDFGEGDYTKEEMAEFNEKTNKFLKDLEEFKKEIIKQNKPVRGYILEVLNRNLDEMKEITKPIPSQYKGSANSLMLSYKTGRPIKGHPHYGKFGIKE